ncbi:hypothetical protein SAG0135_05350 [Streptococcus agalactiae LMG 14609]|nr:hypothetical protein SAG0135_05350 [Streptococcus agalactiae LMG 14609]
MCLLKQIITHKVLSTFIVYIQGDILIKSVYLRVWIGQTVYILDVKEGFKRQRKMSNAVKFVVGIASEVI